jgi:hypothetical protein
MLLLSAHLHIPTQHTRSLVSCTVASLSLPQPLYCHRVIARLYYFAVYGLILLVIAQPNKQSPFIQFNCLSIIISPPLIMMADESFHFCPSFPFLPSFSFPFVSVNV